MKFLIVAILINSINAFAGMQKYTCKNKDGSLIFSDTSFIYLEKKTEKIPEIRILDNRTPHLLPTEGQEIYFVSQHSSSASDVNLVKIIEKKDVKTLKYDEGTKCNGGRGPGYLTIAYQIRAKVQLSDITLNDQYLSCVELNSWAGNCDY